MMERESPALTGPSIEMRIVAEDAQSTKVPTLLEYSQFLVDLNLAYEIGRITTDPKYIQFQFAPTIYSRNGRRLEPDDRLRIRRLSYNSPLEIIGYIPAIAAVPTAIWAFVQIIEKSYTAPLDYLLKKEQLRRAPGERVLQQLNIEKIRLDIAKLEREIPPSGDGTGVEDDGLGLLGIPRSQERAAERLKEHTLRVTSVDIAYIKQLEAGK